MSRRWSKCWGCEPAARPRATVSICFTTPGLGRRHPDGGQEPLHAAIGARRSGHVAVMRQTPREWVPTSAGKTMGIRSRCICGWYFTSGCRHDRDIAAAPRSRWATPGPSALEEFEVRTAKPAGGPCRARQSMISAPPLPLGTNDRIKARRVRTLRDYPPPPLRTDREKQTPERPKRNAPPARFPGERGAGNPFYGSGDQPKRPVT